MPLVRDCELRSGVSLTHAPKDAVLRDDVTGLRLRLGDAAARLVAGLPVSASEAGMPERRLLATLQSLGLFAGTPPADACVQQARYLIDSALVGEHHRVRQTVLSAAASTALHAERLAHALAEPGWRLHDLPLVTREDLRQHFPNGLVRRELDLNALLRTGEVVVASTSGTSGERIQVYSDTRVPRLPPHIESLWGMPGLGRERPIRTAVFTSAVCSGGTCTLRHTPMSERIACDYTLFLEPPRDACALEAREVEAAWEELAAFAPDLLFGNPVYLLMLGRAAARRGLAMPPLRGLVLSYQLASAAQRRALARLFGAPLFDMYSATELAGSQVGISCRHGTMHLRLDHLFAEVLREGEPVPAGELGLLTVTTHNPVMPLVRYQLGDLARLRLSPCPCEVGSSWPGLIVEGRARDAFMRSGRVVTPLAVDQALAGFDFDLYQLRELRPGQFELLVLTELEEAAWRASADDALRTLLAPAELRLRRVTQLSLDASQKFRCCIPAGCA